MSPAAHSDVAWKKIRLAEGRLVAASTRFWNHPNLREILPQFLMQLHHIVRGGLDLMSFAARRAAAMENDAVAATVARYLFHHIDEEKDHAGWLLNDIESLGFSAAEVLASQPSRQVVALLGEQYFWAATAHPVTVFGYLLVLEGTPPLAEELDRIERSTGLPSTAFRCLRSHAEDDPGHLEELNRTLDCMPLNPEQTKRVALAIFQTIEAVASLLDELWSECESAAPGDRQGKAVLSHG